MKLSIDRNEGTLLQRALLANAAFSGICGLLIIVFDAHLVALMTSVEHDLWPLGAMLVAFAAYLLWYTTRPVLHSAWVTSVIVADMAWVVGTVGLVIAWHDVLSPAGIWILVIVGLVVLTFAELQWFGLRRLIKVIG